MPTSRHSDLDEGLTAHGRVTREKLTTSRQDLSGAQFEDLERRDLFHAGCSRYRYGWVMMNLGLQALANRPIGSSAQQARAG
jgi:hypothetical protein